MWFLVVLASLVFNGLPVGIGVAIALCLAAGFTHKAPWYRTVIYWIVGVALGGLWFDAYHANMNCLWHFIGALTGSGVVVWPIHRLIRSNFRGRRRHPLDDTSRK
jgi:hypothetical protein